MHQSPSFLKRVLAACAALLASVGIAHAVITGTWSEKQDEQVAMGQLQMGMGSSTGTLTPTINTGAGIITTTSLSTAAGATQAVTLTNSRVAAGDMVQCTVDPGTSTGTPTCANAKVTAGTVVFTIQNIHSATALNNTVNVMWMINKAGNTN